MVLDTSELGRPLTPSEATIRRGGPAIIDEWISFALVMHPSNINTTAYSYAGRMVIGLVAAPGALPAPDCFLARMREELAMLDAAAGSE